MSNFQTQFKIEGYHYPLFRRDRTRHGGGLMMFVKSDIVTRLAEHEPQEIECICTKITIAKKHWIIFSIYRPPSSGSSLDSFLKVLHQTVDKAITKFKNIVIVGDMNINTLEYSSSLNKLSEFCDTLDLHNLIKVSTCEMQHTSSLIDLILTNRKNCFKHSHAFETGLSDYHKLVTTCFKNTYEKLQPIKIQYRSYKDFQEDAFLSDLQAAPFDHVLDLPNSEMAYNKFKSLFDKVVEKHVPLKKKVLRGNQAPFMTKELSKEIMVRSRLRNKFNKHKTTENWKAYKAQRNKCVAVRRKSIKEHFSSLYTPNRKFWDTVKPFLNDKGSHGHENITLLEDGEIIREGYKISEIFNDHYVNIIKNITGKKQEESQVTNINGMRRHEKEATLDSILERYSSHPSIVSIKMHCPNDGPKFKFTKANPDDICQIIKGIKSHTSTGVDNIPPRLLIMAADIIADPLTDLINATMLEESIFPDAEKRASVTPVFKKDDKLLKTNYRPISVLNVFSKVFERFLLNQMLPFIENVMSSLMSAYRSKYSTQHVLLRLIEQWRTFLDNDRVVGAVLMDLSKAFDCLPHDLLIA